MLCVDNDGGLWAVCHDVVNMFCKEFLDQFVCIHVVFPDPAIGFWPIPLPLDKVIGDYSWPFSLPSSYFAKPTIEDFLHFIIFCTVNKVWWQWQWLLLVWEGWRCLWSKKYLVEYGMNLPVCWEFEGVGWHSFFLQSFWRGLFVCQWVSSLIRVGEGWLYWATLYCLFCIQPQVTSSYHTVSSFDQQPFPMLVWLQHGFSAFLLWSCLHQECRIGPLAWFLALDLDGGHIWLWKDSFQLLSGFDCYVGML